MTPGVLKEPAEPEQLKPAFAVEDLSLLEKHKDSLTAAGRMCYELALAHEAGELIAGTPSEISESLRERTGFDRKSVITAIHDVIHENAHGETYAEMRRANGDSAENPALTLTPEAIQYLTDQANGFRSN